MFGAHRAAEEFRKALLGLGEPDAIAAPDGTVLKGDPKPLGQTARCGKCDGLDVPLHARTCPLRGTENGPRKLRFVR